MQRLVFNDESAERYTSIESWRHDGPDVRHANICCMHCDWITRLQRRAVVCVVSFSLAVDEIPCRQVAMAGLQSIFRDDSRQHYTTDTASVRNSIELQA